MQVWHSPWLIWTRWSAQCGLPLKWTVSTLPRLFRTLRVMKALQKKAAGCCWCKTCAETQPACLMSGYTANLSTSWSMQQRHVDLAAVTYSSRNPPKASRVQTPGFTFGVITAPHSHQGFTAADFSPGSGGAAVALVIWRPAVWFPASSTYMLQCPWASYWYEAAPLVKIVCIFDPIRLPQWMQMNGWMRSFKIKLL